MMFLKLAFRNLLRNKERTLLSLLMVISSTMGLVLFRAYTDDTMKKLEVVATEMNYGHMQIAREAFWKNTFENNEQKLLPNYLELKEVVQQASPDVRVVSGRLGGLGLLSYGVKTENTSLMGYEVSEEEGIKNSILIQEGKYFDPQAADNQILIGYLLAKKLNAKIGDTVTVVANTVDGVINAKEFIFVGSFATGTEEVDKYFSYISLKSLQDLMQTTSVDVLSIKIKDDKKLFSVKNVLQEKVKQQDSSYVVRDWKELSEMFRKVKAFYDMQNLIIKIILVSLVVLGILNTVGMSIFERIGEIGTMRSLGAENPFICSLFFVETLLLSLIGVLVGDFLGYITGIILNSSKITTEVPGASLPIDVAFLFSSGVFLEASLTIVFTTGLVSLIPIYRALRMSIVDSLRRNL